MKIALCLSGGLRNFKDTHYSFKHFLTDCNAVDVFFYGLENKEGVQQNTKDFMEIYSPKKMKVNTHDYYVNIPCKYGLSSSFYSFYNVMCCNDLKKQHEEENGFEYDLVIRSRTDYFWFRHLTEQEMTIAKDKILTPMEWSFKCVAPFAKSDAFAIGNSELMNQYSSLFNRIDEYCSSMSFHPESLCGYHLMINSIPNEENQRCVVFEYPSVRTEKYIIPHNHMKYFQDPDIQGEDEFLREVSNKRKNF